MAMQQKYVDYLAYLERHRRFVLEEAAKLGVTDRGLTHDLSKYERDEFEPYADYFYGGHERGAVPADVQAAWRGAGRAIMGDKSDTAAWYAKNASNMLLHPDTRAWIEAHL